LSIFLSLSLTLSPCLSFNLLVPLHQTLYLRFNLSLYTYLSLLPTFSASSAALYVNLFLCTYLSFSLSVYILSLRFLSLTSQLFPLSSSSTIFSSFLSHLFLSLLSRSLPLFAFFHFSTYHFLLPFLFHSTDCLTVSLSSMSPQPLFLTSSLCLFFFVLYARGSVFITLRFTNKTKVSSFSHPVYPSPLPLYPI